jgi:LEA14-like dessication related protein
MNIPSRLAGFLFIIISLGLGGCATIERNHEKPKVDVVGIQKNETDTAALQFTIQLRIVNPNAETLHLNGLYYELSLEGIDIMTGTANNLPPIEGYSEQIVSVSSAASLMSSIRLMTLLINEPQDVLDYKLRAKIGTTKKWMPSTTIVETGEIPLN